MSELYGRRYKIRGGPWPERIGCICRILPSPVQPAHPWNVKLASEVVVLIENDPLACGCDDPEHLCREDPSWSCVLYRSDLIEHDTTSVSPGVAKSKKAPKPRSTKARPARGVTLRQ